MNNMRFNKWKDVWSSKGFELSNDVTSLQDLIIANGYHGPTAKFTEETWMQNSKAMSQYLKLNEAQSLLEVGCGSGALLYALNKINNLQISGVDYSESLIKLAVHACPEFDLRVSEAKKLPFADNIFSRTISQGVFMYFPDEAYAEKVVKEMLRVTKIGGAISIIDVPDLATKEGSENFREQEAIKEGKEYLTNEESDFSHLYYPKEFFIDVLNKHGLKVEITPQNLVGYGNSNFRYNVVIWNNT